MRTRKNPIIFLLVFTVLTRFQRINCLEVILKSSRKMLKKKQQNYRNCNFIVRRNLDFEI
jgi:hypothetical protein